MANFKFETTLLKDAYAITPFYSGDIRGGFTKVFEKQIYSDAGIGFELDETFISVSAKYVIRGMHFQLRNPQAKIVSVIKGAVFDIIVDLRADSTTYGMWQGFDLSEDNHKALYIPRGFAHGFMSRCDETVMFYQCDGEYNKETDTGIRYDDPDLNIIWPIDCLDKCIHSQRDLELMSFKEYNMNPMKLSIGREQWRV